MKNFALASAVALASVVVAPLVSGGAHAAQPLAGTWRLSDGRTIRFTGGGTRLCGKAVGGKFSGRSIGCLNGSGANYRGKITDLSAGKTYTGKARVNGNSLKLSGCVLGGLICRSVSGTRR